MTHKQAVKIVGLDWVEWLSSLEPRLKSQVLETQIEFAAHYGRDDLRQAFEALR